MSVTRTIWPYKKRVSKPEGDPEAMKERAFAFPPRFPHVPTIFLSTFVVLKISFHYNYSVSMVLRKLKVSNFHYLCCNVQTSMKF